MGVPQGKREPYAVHFVSANKHDTVISQICRTSYTILHKYPRYAYFLICANFRKYAELLARSITLEPHGIFRSNFVYLFILTLSSHWYAKC